MKIFKSYTGNAMLNNALMAIEALAKLKSVEEITPQVLLHLYNHHNLRELNKRLKSYTMLFTKNGPLHNDAKNGSKVYDALMCRLIQNVELEGDKICEISGLRFNTTFETHFITALRDVGLSDKEIKRKDTSLNRTWFPLIGGLGSDAQALPQAKYTIQIHPICIAIMQFMPLASFLYKRGILLIDSSNFEFARRYIASNVKELQHRIEGVSVSASIENVKDFSKGNYLLNAISILDEMKFDDEYSDLNLWSFSNIGTGASCEIDRVPNVLIKKLMHLQSKSRNRTQLEEILSDNYKAHSFLKALEDNEDWSLLYPQVWGTGKKRVEHKGYPSEFLEAYYKEIGCNISVEYAKYVAFLIKKYKSESFDKILEKTDAYNEKEYRVELYKVLVEATRNKEWDLYHHIDIIDKKDDLPISNTFYHIQKLIHFYYQKNIYSEKCPDQINEKSEVLNVCKWLIAFIQNDERTKTKEELQDKNKYNTVGFINILLRYARLNTLPLDKLLYAFYNEDYFFVKTGLNELLRIFFSQVEQHLYEVHDLELPLHWQLDEGTRKWLHDMELFVEDYQSYYFEKYENKVTGRLPFGKFLELISSIPNDNSGFLKWMEEAVNNVNDFLWGTQGELANPWGTELLYSPQGVYALSFAKLSIQVLLFRRYRDAMRVSESKEILNK